MKTSMKTLIATSIFAGALMGTVVITTAAEPRTPIRR